jgi:hypothetical protein
VRASFFVALAIAGSAIAVPPVAHERGPNKGDSRVSVISAAPPGASIIETGNVPIAAA